MIDSFSGEYRFLSNFFPSVVDLDGELYSTVEHAYQAAKTMNICERDAIRSLDYPGEAKRAGRKLSSVRKDWNKVKVNIMRNLLEQKFYVGSILYEKLLQTTPHQLVEGNTWGDKFWGQCPVGEGKNVLGNLLMEIRDTPFS